MSDCTELIGSISAAVGAAAALLSVYYANQTIVHASTAATTERKSMYFRLTVFDPLWTAMSEFRVGVTAAASAVAKALDGCRKKGVSVGDAEAVIHACVQAIDDAFYDLKSRLHIRKQGFSVLLKELETLHESVTTAAATIPVVWSSDDPRELTAGLLDKLLRGIESVCEEAQKLDPGI